MKKISTLALLILLAISPSVFAEKQKTVLITGASSGLGLRMTEVLSANGFLVYAGVYKEVDFKRLEAMKNVEAVQFDVTKPEQIAKAVKVIEAKGRGLYGLINNAGVAVFGPVIEIPVEQLQYQMDVNVYGPYRVTQAFAPMIIESKGRIATTGSIAGIRAGSMFGIYGMSKHAIEAYTEALSAELARFDVSVGVIEPGNYASEIGNTALKRIKDTNYWSEETQYKASRDNMFSRLPMVTKGKNPKDVADAALHFMSNTQPKMRYMVTPDEAQANTIIRASLSKALQLNQGQDYSYDEATLIKMLKEEAIKLNPETIETSE
jgi:NAD(P)-dependent dehydrogenase (short-subunit alcohol dehydrogenase family)